MKEYHVDLQAYLPEDADLRSKDLDIVALACRPVKDEDMGALAYIADKLGKVGARIKMSRYEDEGLDILTLSLSEGYVAGSGQPDRRRQARAHLGDMDVMTVFCDGMTGQEQKRLQELSGILDKVGVSLDLSATHGHKMLSISIDYDTYNRVTGRGAGRKKDPDMADRYRPCTVSKLNKLLNSGKKKSEIIEYLGCPKMTFYRILKNMEGAPARASIWDYTTPK